MKLKALALLFALIPGLALGAQNAVVDQHFPALNFLKNPGFENGNAGWFASGGATKTVSGSAKATGTVGYDWDSNSAAQTLVSISVTVPEGLYGKNGLAYCKVQVPSGTATTTFTANDGSNDLATAITISSSTTFAIQAVTFTWPSSGSVRLKFTSVASNEPDLKIDDCFLGENYKIGSGNFIGPWVTWTPTGSFIANTTYTGLWRRVGNIMEVQVRLSFAGAPTTTTLSVNMPTGFTIDTTNLLSITGAINTLGFGHILDSGVTELPVIVRYGSTSSVTIYSFANAGGVGNAFDKEGNVTQAVPIVIGSADAIDLAYRVPVVGWGSGDIYTVDSIGWRVDANISGANPSLGTSNQSAYIGIEDSGLTLTNNTGNGILTAQIPCSSTNAPSGTTCAAGNESIGVSFFLPRSGDVLACASFGHDIGASTAGGRVQATFQVVETPTNAQTISQEGKSRVQSADRHQDTAGGTNMASAHPVRVCGTFTFASSGQKVLRLMYEQVIAATVTSNVILADASATLGQQDIHWEVYPLNQPAPAPILVGSVLSNTTGIERIERALITNGGSCAISTQSGSWLSSVSRPGTGKCDLVVAAGMFLSAPTCFVNQNVASATNVDGVCNVRAGSTATAVGVTCGNNSLAAADRNFDIICMGPR